MRLVLIALSLASLVFGQGAASRNARIEGTVRSGAGLPIERASITLYGNDGSSATTADESGKFVIDNVPPASGYRISVTRPGYVQAWYGANTPGGSGVALTLTAGQVLTNVAITMTPQGVVSGQITDAAGDPVQNALVMVLRATFSGTTRELRSAGSATTDDRGEYRIANLNPGQYYLSALDRRVPSRLATEPAEPPTGSNITTYYPNAGDPQGAARFNVEAGGVMTGMDLRLRMSGYYAVRGKAVYTASGSPAADVTVTSLRTSDPSSQRFLSRVNTQTDEDGSFEFANLQPGSYTFEFQPLRAEVGNFVGRADLIVTNKDIDDVFLRLRPPSVLTGTMRLEGGDIKSLIPEGSASRYDRQDVDAQLEAIAMSQRGSTPPNVRPLVWLQSTVSAVGGAARGILQEDGTFRIDTVRPGQWWFRVEILPEGVYVKSARSGGLNALVDPVDMREADATLDIVLARGAGEASGFVRNERGEPEANVTVTLWPTVAAPGRPPYSGTISTITDQTGSYRLRRIPPGDYHLAAWTASDRGLLSSHAFLTLFNSRAAKVEVEESARLTVEAKVMPAEVVRQEVAKLR